MGSPELMRALRAGDRQRLRRVSGASDAPSVILALIYSTDRWDS